MNVKSLCVVDWHEYAEEYLKKNGALPYRLAFCIENSQFSIARYYGGLRLDGHDYICECPRESVRVDSRRVWIAVERGFWNWVRRRCSSKDGVVITGVEQGMLHL